MNKLHLPNFNHKVTLLGGQSFSWDEVDNGEYIGCTQDKVIKVKFVGEDMYWQTYPEADDLDYINHYFNLDLDYPDILKEISNDLYVEKAMKEFPNIRILQQPLDLTIFSFIMSANNNIQSIRRSYRMLSQMYGDKVCVDGIDVYLFPKTDVLAQLSEEDIRKSKVGFRAKYIKNTADTLVNTNLRKEILTSSTGKAHDHLTSLYGVGDKVADCVLTFSLGVHNITPIDVWAKRILTDLYGLPDNMKYDEYKAWLSQAFGGYAALAGQFLFEWYRKKS